VQRVDELFADKAKRIQALGTLGQIALQAVDTWLKDPDGDMGKLVQTMGKRLPEHYSSDAQIQQPEYRVVPFVDSQSLIALISEVESFLQDTMIAVLCLHPGKLSKTSIEVKTLSSLGSIAAAVEYAAQKYVSDLMYKRPVEYKKALLEVLSASECMLDDVWPAYVEAKARRDLGVHNSWRVNSIYISKIQEVGVSPPKGEHLHVTYEYFLKAAENCIKLMGAVRVHCESTFRDA
jgi:hypothetical protein